MLKRYSFVIGTLLLSFSCSSSTKVLSTSETETVKVGKEFEISMRSNPTTGYCWIWANKGDAAADSVDHKFVSNAENSGRMMCGAGGTEVWTFKAKKTGADSLKFYYLRPWEKNSLRDSMIFHFELK